MHDPTADDRQDEAFWRQFLLEGSPVERAGRRVLSRIPHGPRCRMCGAPFDGIGAPVMRLIGKRPSDRNPSMCRGCFEYMERHRGGAEVPCTLLFADIRGSTALGEQLSPADFRALLARFYDTASAVVFAHDGMVDKFVGDELVAMFPPLLSRDRHVANALAAARDLLVATGHGTPDGPWVPIGAGVHTGPTWIGAIGDAGRVELTAVGDSVNTTARLAAHAAPGEVLVSADAATAVGLDGARRALELKGKSEPFEVVSLRVD